MTMIWPDLQSVAQIAIGRVVNSLPEALLIVLFAGVMLRLLRRQNSGTRFAVWLVALLAVAGLPLMGGMTSTHSFLATGGARPWITLPAGLGLFLFLAWVMAALVAMLRLVVGLWRLHALRRSCVAIDEPELDSVTRKTLADFVAVRAVTLGTSEHMNVPAAIGFFKPMIVLPAWTLRELSAAELNVILLHEFAHLRRGDAWTNLLQKVVRAVFLFHPAVWWIERRLSLEREMACDDQVLAETANPHGYAKCLIALLEKSVARRGWAMAQAAVNRAREASLRLARILDDSRPGTRNVWKPALGFVGAFSLLCLTVLPRAPQFVAFEANTPAVQTADWNAPPLGRSGIAAAAVIPAAMHESSSVSFKKMPRRLAMDAGGGHVSRHVSQHISQHISQHQPAAPQMIAARANQSDVQAADTLFIIRTAERVGPNSWMWNVYVWRVTWVNPPQDAVQAGAVTDKT